VRRAHQIFVYFSFRLKTLSHTSSTGFTRCPRFNKRQRWLGKRLSLKAASWLTWVSFNGIKLWEKSLLFLTTWALLKTFFKIVSIRRALYFKLLSLELLLICLSYSLFPLSLKLLTRLWLIYRVYDFWIGFFLLSENLPLSFSLLHLPLRAFFLLYQPMKHSLFNVLLKPLSLLFLL
jgi:hypothetical protein